jgi:hypothetical protein
MGLGRPAPGSASESRTGTPPDLWIWKGSEGVARTYDGKRPVNRKRWNKGLGPHWATLILDDDERRRRRQWHPPGGAYRFLG